MKVVWNGVTLAESDEAVNFLGTVYFPHEAINEEYFQESDTHTTCWIKGQASYYDIVVNGTEKKNGAWYYPQPLEKAQEIGNYVAFYLNQGVELAR